MAQRSQAVSQDVETGWRETSPRADRSPCDEGCGLSVVQFTIRLFATRQHDEEGIYLHIRATVTQTGSKARANARGDGDWDAIAENAGPEILHTGARVRHYQFPKRDESLTIGPGLVGG